MTVEIRELVIKAQVGDSDHPSNSVFLANAKNRREESDLVELISQKVLERLREELGRDI